MYRHGLVSKLDRVPSPDECEFYHVMEVPGVGVTSGQWDLRGRLDEYLGQYVFSGKRVLEIGPASGFLTFEIERRGGAVVAVEVTDEHGWDFVPYPRASMGEYFANRARHMERIKNSFWMAHHAFKSRATVLYGDAYDLPDELGQFDVAVMAAVLLHCRAPLQIIEQCVRRAKAVVIVDLLYADIEGMPVCRLQPTAGNSCYDTWWNLSSTYLAQFLEVLGMRTTRIHRHQQNYVAGSKGSAQETPFFTIVAERVP